MKYLLVSMMIAVGIMNLQAQNVPSYVPTNGLTAWYPFNGNANDESGNGNNGTLNGSPVLTTDRFGNTNNALNLAGAPEYLAFPSGNSTNLNITGNFTASFWIKTTSSSGPLLICGDNVYSPYSGYFSAINGGNLGAGKIGISTNGSWHVSNSSINNNQWSFISYVFDSGVFKLYIDGVLEATFNNIIPSNSWNGNRVFGCRSDLLMNSTTNYVERVDDIGIWNRALTQQEITALFTGINCTPPTATITPATSTNFCSGGSVVLNANTDTTFSYQWQLNGTNITGATNASYTATASGNYTVIISNATNCADTSTAVNVTVNPVPSATIAAMGNTTFCSGGSVMLSSNSGTGFTYVWKKNGTAITGATSSTYSATTSGTYNVQVTNSNNCSSTSTSITVTVNPSPTATLTAATSTTFCTGGSVVLNANTGTGLSYQWKKNNTNISGATSASYTATTQGSYVVVVSGSNGCSATSTATTVTVNPTPTVTLTSLPSFVNLAAGAINLNGSPTGGFYSGAGAQGNTFLASAAGLGSSTITYNYTNANGCSSSAFQSTIVYDTTGTVCTTYDTVTTLVAVTDTLVINAVITSLAPPNNLNTIKIYPNPTSDHITINYGNYAMMSGYQLKIENALGQVVFTKAINLASSYIDLSSWSGNGIYFVKVIDPTGIVVENRKIVLQ